MKDNDLKSPISIVLCVAIIYCIIHMYAYVCIISSLVIEENTLTSLAI